MQTDQSDPVQIAMMLASMLQDLQPQVSTVQNKLFHGFNVPNITIQNYLMRLVTTSGCSSSCLILTLVYLDRLWTLQPQLQAQSKQLHRLILISFVVSIKYLDEKFQNNRELSLVGGVSLKELNNLQRQFVRLLGFNFFVESDVYDLYRNSLFHVYQDHS